MYTRETSTTIHIEVPDLPEVMTGETGSSINQFYYLEMFTSDVLSYIGAWTPPSSGKTTCFGTPHVPSILEKHFFCCIQYVCLTIAKDKKSLSNTQFEYLNLQKNLPLCVLLCNFFVFCYCFTYILHTKNVTKKMGIFSVDIFQI